MDVLGLLDTQSTVPFLNILPGELPSPTNSLSSVSSTQSAQASQPTAEVQSELDRKRQIAHSDQHEPATKVVKLNPAQKVDMLAADGILAVDNMNGQKHDASAALFHENNVLSPENDVLAASSGDEGDNDVETEQSGGLNARRSSSQTVTPTTSPCAKVAGAGEGPLSSFAYFKEQTSPSVTPSKRKSYYIPTGNRPGRPRRDAPPILKPIKMNRPRGRPRIHPMKDPNVKRPRGRPRIHPPKDPNSPRRPPGRPRDPNSKGRRRPRRPATPKQTPATPKFQFRVVLREPTTPRSTDNDSKRLVSPQQPNVSSPSVPAYSSDIRDTDMSGINLGSLAMAGTVDCTDSSQMTKRRDPKAPKKPRGRPRIHPIKIRGPRGRPRKHPLDPLKGKRTPGRPRIHPLVPRGPRGRPPAVRRPVSGKQLEIMKEKIHARLGKQDVDEEATDSGDEIVYSASEYHDHDYTKHAVTNDSEMDTSDTQMDDSQWQTDAEVSFNEDNPMRIKIMGIHSLNAIYNSHQEESGDSHSGTHDENDDHSQNSSNDGDDESDSSMNDEHDDDNEPDSYEIALASD